MSSLTDFRTSFNIMCTLDAHDFYSRCTSCQLMDAHGCVADSTS